MTTATAPEGTLFTMDANGYGESAMEKSVRASIDAIHAERPIPPARRFLAQTAMELARSISKGNQKGRAVAMESAQLVATLELLNPTDDGPDGDELPAELKDLIDAFASKPVHPVSRPS